jgi:ABC-type oligopeptide transport system substrate-binding subunit/class 3 adenylate cyclase
MTTDVTGRAESAMREERRTVTVLAADIVGSTALAERLDPEETRLVIGEAVARMVRAVESFGGTVKDLAGDGCLALFGAPVAHEDDAERAVRAGLLISQDLSAYGAEVARSWSVEGMNVRVGIATGPVVVGAVGGGSRTEYGAFGDTVNTAARLQAAAAPGSVLVALDTRRLLGPGFEWSEPRALTLRGKAEAVEASDVLAAPPSGSARRPVRTDAPLVGREVEMRTLEAAADALLDGSGGVVILSGEPGIGKSRLVAELHRRVMNRSIADTRWLEGRCLSYGESLPYWPFRELLREWLGVSANDPELRTRIALRRQVEELYGEQALDAYPYLASLLDLETETDATSRLAALSPEAMRYRTWEVIGELLTRVSRAGPLVVVLEDLHWADATSLGLVERLLQVTEDSAVLLVLTHRQERDHASWRVRETVVREYPHRTHVIDLDALPGEAERELLASLVGRDTLPGPVERRLLDAAEGNPFFLEQLVGSLADEGALARDGDGWRFDHEVDVDVPPHVGQVIVARIDRLAPEDREVLLAAAVLGRRFDLELLTTLAGDTPAARDSLRALQRVDLVREARRWPQPEYQFKHVLIQEAAYGTLPRTRRVELHRRAAEWLEERYASSLDEVYGLLAHHWLAAEDEARAVDYLMRAGDRARSEHALDESIAHYRTCLPLLERRGDHQRMAIVLFKLGLALHFELRFAEASSTFEEAFRSWTPPAPATAAATLRIASNAMPFMADPPRSHFLQNIQFEMGVLDRLVELGPEQAIFPGIAEHWEIAPDGLRYVFTLAEGCRWSDGRPLTAHDVEFGIKRNLDPERPGASVAIYFVLEGAEDYYLSRHRDLERVGVRALDDRRVEFRLVAPAPYFLIVLNRPDAAPHPRHAIEEHGDAWTDPANQVVSGAFRCVEWTNERVVLERREGGRPRSGNIARVEYDAHGLDDALDAYRRNDADLVILRSVDLRSLEEAFPAEIVTAPAAGTTFLALDTQAPPLDDVRMRRALVHAIDRDALHETLPVQQFVARGGLVPPALRGHTPDIAPRFDPALARELAESVGTDRPIRVIVLTGGIVERPLEFLVDSWRTHLGVAVEAVRTTQQEMAALADPRTAASVIPAGWFPGYPDPEYFVRLLLHSHARDNAARYSDLDFDALIERARNERDGARRLELFHEADRIAVAERVAVIPLAYGRNNVLVKPWVRGWWEYGKAWSSFADLHVDERSPRAVATATAEHG